MSHAAQPDLTAPATPPEGAPRGGPAAPPVRWWQGWAPLLVLPAGVLLFFPPSWPRWALMWALSFALYAGC